MPKALQIENFKRLFLRANDDYDDPDAEMANIDFENAVEDDLSFRENLRNFEEQYPQYRWKVPKKNPLGEERPVWKSKFDLEGNTVAYTAIVLVKPHRVTAKNRTYLHGRIQATVDRKWIGCKAKVSIQVPVGKRG